MNGLDRMLQSKKGKEALWLLGGGFFISIFRFNLKNDFWNTVGDVTITIVSILFLAWSVFTFREFKKEEQ